MIVYIIPGKTKTVQAAVDYVCDENKTAKNFNDARTEYERSPELQANVSLEDYLITCEDNFNRALNYIANEDKIGGYISGYLCDPEFCEEQFIFTKSTNLERVKKNLEDDNGNFFYHIIQSFPEGLDISDDEVHRCGVELVERLGLYQAIVTSHIHPAIDEEGKIHGKCKHNHILINSHIYHEFIDEANPYKMKYHDCNETYTQLQLINDQIAIEHGLPIIDKPDMGKVYSWFESKENNEGKSWKARVKIDISNAMRGSMNLDTYLESMRSAGYKIRTGNSKKHGQYIAYTCPEEEHVVRDYILGNGYRIPELEKYWNIKIAINEEVENNTATGENKIETLLDTTDDPLFIKFKNELSEKRKENLREKNINYRKTYTNYIPLTTTKKYSAAELSYFDSNEIYEIVNSNHQTITEVTGDEILAYFHRIYEREQQQKEEEEKRRKENAAKAYYSSFEFIKSATRDPYKVHLYDKTGRKRSFIELLVILAIVTIEKEYGKWQPPKSFDLNSEEIKDNPIYAKKDWKVQNMVDTVQIAQAEKVQNPNEVEQKIAKVGKELSKARADIRRLTDAKNRMETLFRAIDGYNEVKEICEKIYDMPDGPEKSRLQKEYEEEIEEYKRHKSTMYRFNATSEEKIQDFLERYEEIKVNIQRAEAQAQEFNSSYSRLMKLKYNIQLAQNKQYCYGPEYRMPEPEQEQVKESEPEQDQNELN